VEAGASLTGGVKTQTKVEEVAVRASDLSQGIESRPDLWLLVGRWLKIRHFSHFGR